MKTADVTAISPEATDEHLVTAAQSGSPEAFAALFRRYHAEIARYAARTLGDEARAEDAVQETFLSALRGLRTLDRPAGFRPWLYRIAHNACVDMIRRRGRGEEVLFDAGRIPPAEEIRLFRQAPSSHAALAQKEEFGHLRQALCDLPEQQAQILVMRELEGLSYEDIAARMGISHSAVESLLFRARRALRAEYGEISTGERCRKMRALMAQAVEGVGRRRDRVVMARHIHGCASCRRDALVMGLGPIMDLDRRGLRGGLSKVAALLPLPGFLNRRTEETSQLSAGGSSSLSLASHAQTAIGHVTVSAGASVEHAATVMQKAAAVVAAAAVVGGGGFVASETRTAQPAPAAALARHVADGAKPAPPSAAVLAAPPAVQAPPLTSAPAAPAPPTALSGTASPATAAPAAPPSSAPAASEPLAEDSAEPEPVTFDVSSTSPEPVVESTSTVEPTPVETPLDVPTTEPTPVGDAYTPETGDQPPPSGGAGVPDDDPGTGADTGGSGPVE